MVHVSKGVPVSTLPLQLSLDVLCARKGVGSKNTSYHSLYSVGSQHGVSEHIMALSAAVENKLPVSHLSRFTTSCLNEYTELFSFLLQTSVRTLTTGSATSK